MLASITGTYRAAFAGLPREIWTLSAITLVHRAGTMVLPFFALFLTRDRDLPLSLAGQLVALYGLGALVGSYVGGWLSDRIGSIRAQQASLAGAGLGYLSIVAADSVPALAVTIFLASAAAEAFRPAVMTAIAHRAPAGLTARSFALLRLSLNLGMAIGPAAGGFLATRSYTLLFVVDAATAWAAAALLQWLMAPRRVGAAAETAEPGGPARSPWRDPPFLLLMLLVTGMASSLFQVFSTKPVHLQRAYGMLEDRVGVILAFNAVLIVLFEMVVTHWAERRDRILLIGVGSFLICAGLALLPLGSTFAFALVATAVWTVGEMLALPLTNAVVADRATPATRGRYMGLYTMTFSAAFVFAPLVGTRVYEGLGPAALWYGLGGFGVLLLAGSAVLAPSFRGVTPGAASGPDPGA